MYSIMTRRAVEFWGGRAPRADLAYVVDGRVVTWAEVMDKRRERQRERLRRKRECGVNQWRAYKLWVAYFYGIGGNSRRAGLMGGWHAFLDDVRGRRYGQWIDRDRSSLKPKLMKLFPLLLPLGGERAQWDQWKVAFARRFERRRQCRQPLGVTLIWWNQRDDLRLGMRRNDTALTPNEKQKAPR